MSLFNTRRFHWRTQQRLHMHTLVEKTTAQALAKSLGVTMTKSAAFSHLLHSKTFIFYSTALETKNKQEARQIATRENYGY